MAKPIKMMHKVQQKVSAPDGCPGHKPATTNQHGSCESCHWDTYCHWAAAGQLCSGDVCCRRGFVVNGDLFGVPVGSSQVRYSYILPVSVDISHKYSSHGSRNIHQAPENSMPYQGRQKATPVAYLSCLSGRCSLIYESDVYFAHGQRGGPQKQQSPYPGNRYGQWMIFFRRLFYACAAAADETVAAAPV